MTLEELKSHEGAEDIKIKTNQEEFLIVKKASGNYSMSWWASDSSIIITTRELISTNEDTTLVNKQKEIKYKNIERVEIDESDGLKTTSIILGLFLTAALIILIATIDLDSPFPGPNINLGEFK